ncbi:hypothetical protein [Zunongwangia sp. H14]|uniref:hypothetical protein n=1 Tax=Zunongwangia sp. H14 TaxID=3240792 RepID=UPI003565F547
MAISIKIVFLESKKEKQIGLIRFQNTTTDEYTGPLAATYNKYIMARKLILTPYEDAYLTALNYLLNETSIKNSKTKIDVPHILFSSLIMAGVDKIESSEKFESSNTKLITHIDRTEFLGPWADCINMVRKIFNNYQLDTDNKDQRNTSENVSNQIGTLFYALKHKSSILTFSPIEKIDRALLPPELKFPLDILFSSIQSKSATLPILEYDLPKKEVERLIDVLNGREFKNYSDAQKEIELNSNLTEKTIHSIELAGKELYNKNRRVLNLKENLIKAIPLSSKVIELFFGKLPGILTEYSSTILSDYSREQKTIPLYNCQPIVHELLENR